MQLAAAIEDRLGIVTEDGMLNGAQTLGDLRQMIAGELGGKQLVSARKSAPPLADQLNRASITQPNAPEVATVPNAQQLGNGSVIFIRAGRGCCPSAGFRVAFIELVMRPLVWRLAHPRVTAPKSLKVDAPLLIIANHVSTFDGPLIQYACAWSAIRRHIAAAMSGEMLNDYRHFRNPEKFDRVKIAFFLPGPLFYYLLTGSFQT